MEGKAAIYVFLGSLQQRYRAKTNKMKKVPFSILVLLLVCNTCYVFAQDITNGNMEEWAELLNGNKEHPVGWTTRNHIEDNPQANYSLQVDDPYKGEKAIRLQNFRVSPELSLGSFLSLGVFDPSNPSKRGVGFNHRPVSLNFAYKYFTSKANPSGFYEAKAIIRLTRWSSANNASILVADGEYSIVEKTNNYLVVELELEYYDELQPDSLFLSFTTPSNPNDQVRLTLDDIRLVYDTPTSNDIPYLSNEIALYPNPANTFLNIEQPQGFDDSQLLVFDALGRLQMQYILSSKEETVDIASLDTGFYFYQIRRENELVKSGKFLKSFD